MKSLLFILLACFSYAYAYDGNQAADYAIKWSESSNSDIYPFYAQDCTNFASQALFAGGFNMNPIADDKLSGLGTKFSFSNNEWYFKFNDTTKNERYGMNITRSKSWSVANKLFLYLKNSQKDNSEIIFQENFENLDRGDLIFLDFKDTGYMGHVLVVSDISPLRVSAHTEKRNNHLFSEFSSSAFKKSYGVSLNGGRKNENGLKTIILNIKNPTGDFIKSLQYPIYNAAQNKSFTQNSVTILTKSVTTSVPDEPSDGSWINPIDPTEVILPQQGAGKPYSLDVDNSSSGFDPNDYRWQYKWSTKNDDILLINNGKTATIEAKCKNACNNRLPIAMNMVDPDGKRHYLMVKVFFASDGITAQPITCSGSWSTALFSIGMTEIASQSCQTGYTGSKSLSHVCQSDGQWGQTTTTDNCTVIPPTITNCAGVWTNQAYAIGATEEKYASSCPSGTNGQVRSFHVCQSSGQWGGLATSDNCTTFLETPTNLYGSSTSNGIQLTWSQVSGAVSYYVYKMGNFLQEVFDNIFTDTNVSNGTTYQYEVAAHSTLNNQNVTSPKSSAISTTYNAAQTGIAAPNGFNAARGTNGIVLSWQPVTGADAYYIYRYGYSNPTTGGNMLLALGASESAFIDYSQMGLISGQSYCYFIRAVKGNVLSPSSTDACSHAP